jgi:hypothetical protein
MEVLRILPPLLFECYRVDSTGSSPLKRGGAYNLQKTGFIGKLL